MTTAHFSLDNFKSQIALSSVASADRFEVTITTPNCLAGTFFMFTDLASLFVEHVSFPQMVINNKRLQIYGPSEPRPHSLDYGGENLGITFILDSGMKIKQMFDYWMQSIVDVDSALVAYQADYTCTIEIKQLDKGDYVTYSCLIEDAYPYVQSQLESNNSSAGAVHRLNVGWAYRKWTDTFLPNFGQGASQSARDTNVTVTTL